jgi:hypothetical protein
MKTEDDELSENKNLTLSVIFYYLGQKLNSAYHAIAFPLTL